MKNKKFKKILLFLIFVLLFTSIFPVKIANAVAVAPIIGIAVIAGIIFSPWIRSLFSNMFFIALAAFTSLITGIFHWLLVWINNGILAPIIDATSRLNPFEGANIPIKVLWLVLRNLSYIILVFASLAAGFAWLLEQQEEAKKTIFNIIIVAILMNFTYVLIEESFSITQNFIDGITNYSVSKVGIGTMMAISLWQINPNEELQTELQAEISKSTDPQNAKYIADIFQHIFLVILDMFIFVTLFVSALLFVTRYVMIILLTAISPIVVTTIVFPEFKGLKGVSEIFPGRQIFDNWLSNLLNWLLVGPVFIYLIMIGNILKANTLDQINVQSEVVKLVILDAVLMGWYIIALQTAKKMSKGVTQYAEKFAWTLLSKAGLLAASPLVNIARRGLGSFLQNTGNFISEKIPVTPLTAWMHKAAGWSLDTANKLKKPREEMYASIIDKQLEKYFDEMSKTTDKSVIANNIQKIANLAQKYKNNPEVQKKIASRFERAPTKVVEQIATNEQAMSILLDKDMPQELKDAVSKRTQSLSWDTLMDIIKNKNILSGFLTGYIENRTAFLKNLENTSAKKIINTMADMDDNNLKQLLDIIEKDSDFSSAINKATSGLYKAITEGKTENIATSLLDIGKDAFENLDKIEKIAKIINPSVNIRDSVKYALFIDPESVLKSAVTSKNEHIKEVIGSMDFNEIVNQLNPKGGSDVERYLNMLLDYFEKYQ